MYRFKKTISMDIIFFMSILHTVKSIDKFSDCVAWYEKHDLLDQLNPQCRENNSHECLAPGI